MGLASAQCTPKCTFDSGKVNFDFKSESINSDITHDPYKPRSTSLSAADAISFTNTDLSPTNAGTGGCPSTFTTLSFTYPGGKGKALNIGSYNYSNFYIQSTNAWDFKVYWGTDYSISPPDPYSHPVLAVMLLIGSTDNVIYASKMVYFTRTGVSGFDKYLNSVLQTKEVLLPGLCASIFAAASLTPTTQ